MQAPHIKTELPGPKARAIVERDKQSVSPSYTRDYPLVMGAAVVYSAVVLIANLAGDLALPLVDPRRRS